VTSDELSNIVEDYCKRFVLPPELLRLCKERVLGPGNSQYSLGNQQTFEIIPMDRLSLMFDEEVADVLVYIVMLSIRLTECGYCTAAQYLESFAEAVITAYNDLNESMQGVERND